MTDSSAELGRCPFCGAGETILDRQTYWTGMSSQVLSVTVKHWCVKTEGQLQSMVLIKRKTEADAIAAWNARSQPSEWVATSERLPDSIGSYLVYGPLYEPHINEIAWSFFNSDKNWCDTIGYFTEGVSHWMPLPKPPALLPPNTEAK